MVSPKLAVIICLYVICTEYNLVSTTGTRDLVNQTEQLLEELRKSVSTATKIANTRLVQVMDGLNSATEEDAEEAKKRFESASDLFLQQIANITANATKAGVNISECTGDSEDEIKALPNNTLNVVTECLSEKMEVDQQIINDTVGHINSSWNVLTELGDKITACSKKSLIEQNSCFDEVTADITADMVSLPVVISNNMSEVESINVMLTHNLTICISEGLADITAKGALIVANVSSCAEEKINAANTTSLATEASSSTKAGATSVITLTSESTDTQISKNHQTRRQELQ